MTSALMKLLALVALVVMPFGMTRATAMAQPMPADHSMTAMGHCDEQPKQDKGPVSKMDCTAMCTALPATDTPPPDRIARLHAPQTIALVAPFAGVVLEIATPPPRLV